MALSESAKLSIAFKKLIGHEHRYSSNQWYNECPDRTMIFHKDSLMINEIPSVPPGASNSAIKVYTTAGDGDITMCADNTIPGNRGWRANDGGALRNFIHPKYGSGYVVRVYEDDGIGGLGDEIPTSDTVEWTFDYENGYLSLENSPSSWTLPIHIEAYKYTGSFLKEYMEFTALSTDAPTPPSNTIRLYALQSAGVTKIKYIDSAGTSVQLGAGGGGGNAIYVEADGAPQFNTGGAAGYLVFDSNDFNTVTTGQCAVITVADDQHTHTVFSNAVTISPSLTVGSINITANASVQGTLHVSGATTFGSTLNVSGQATFNNNVVVSGNATPGTDKTFNIGSNTERWNEIYTNTIHIGTASTITKFQSTASGTIHVTGNLYVTSDNTNAIGANNIRWNALFVNNATISTLNVTANASIQNTLHVCGATTFGSSVNISGAVSISNTLFVCGTTTLNGLTVSGNATVGNLSVTSNATVVGTLNVCGIATFSNHIVGSGKLTISGAVSLGSTLEVASWISVVGAISTSSTLHVSSNATISGSLTIGGISYFNNDVSITGNLTVHSAIFSKLYIEFTSNTTLSVTAPSAGIRLFGKASGTLTKLMTVDSAGTEVQLGAGGGAGFSIYIDESATAHLNNAAADMHLNFSNEYFNVAVNGTCATVTTVAGAGNANVALSNLAAVAVNASLEAGTDYTLNIGGVNCGFDTLYVRKIEFTPANTYISATAAGSVKIGGTIWPAVNEGYSIGGQTCAWNTIYVKNIKGTADGGAVSITVNGLLCGSAGNTTSVFNIGGITCAVDTIYVNKLEIADSDDGAGNTVLWIKNTTANTVEFYSPSVIKISTGLNVQGAFNAGTYTTPSTTGKQNQFGNLLTGPGPASNQFGLFVQNAHAYASNTVKDMVGVGGYVNMQSEYHSGGRTIGLQFTTYVPAGYRAPSTGGVSIGIDTMGIYGFTSDIRLSKSFGIVTSPMGMFNGSAVCSAAYGILVADVSAGGVNVWNVSAQYGMAIDKPTIGTNNYQVLLSGEGTGTGIWLSTVTGARVFSSGLKDLNFSLNSTTIVTINSVSMSIAASQMSAQFTLSGTSTANCGIWFDSIAGCHIGAVSGHLYVSTLPSTASTVNPIYWDNTSHKFHLNSSSRRYKENISDYNDQWNKILSIRPKKFTGIGGTQYRLGYIAEDIDNLGLGYLVNYNEHAEPESLNYELFSVYAIEVIKEQQTRINRLEDELAKVVERINKMVEEK